MAVPHHHRLHRDHQGGPWGRVPRTLALLLAAVLLPLSCPTRAAADPTPSARPVGGEGLAGAGVLFDPLPGVPAPPPLAAASYLVADLGTGAVLVAKAPHAGHLPASALKTLTALTVMPLLDPRQVYRAQREDLVEGSKVGLSPGSTYTVQQLLQGMMLSSGNDCATALARAAGGVPQTVSGMQARAHDLGALDTVVKDPSGLDAPGQVTSAYDLALIAREALKSPAFRSLVTTKRVRFPGKEAPGKKRASYQIQNHNTLLYNYQGTVGVKNGYTVAARWTIVGAATRGDHTYVVTALARADRSWRPTAALLDWAFAHGSRAHPIGRLVEPGEVAAEAAAATKASAAAGASHRGSAAGPSLALPAVADRHAQTWVGAVGLAAAVLLVLLLGLSARVRRRRLRRRRSAPSARPARP